jgi:hypothetical protein
MAIGWLTVLKNVPWTEVIGNAPKVADGARKLWNNVGKKVATPESTVKSEPPGAEPGEPAIDELRSRLAALEEGAAGFHEQLLASSDLIKALAEQNAQLINRIQAHRVRLSWLAGAIAVVGVIAGAAMTLALMR